MTENIKIAMIVAAGPMFTSCLALLHQVVKDKKWEQHRKEMLDLQQQAARDIKIVEVATNSMKDALVKATGEAKHAEGVADEKARSKAESASKEAAVQAERDKVKSEKPNI